MPPELIASHNKQDGVIKFTNGSEILYMGMASSEDVQKLKSMELGFFCFDEANEIPKEAFLYAQACLRHKIADKSFPPYKGILTTNPSECWLKYDFVENGEVEEFRFKDHSGAERLAFLRSTPETIFIPALPIDNPGLPTDYVDQLAKLYPDDWVRVYLEGSWDEVSSESIIIPPNLVRMAINREIPLTNKFVMGVDIARADKDETVIIWGNGGHMMGIDAYTSTSIMETTGRMIACKSKNNVEKIVFDKAGLGIGVDDRLAEVKMKGRIGVNGGESSSSDRFQNLKTEMLWNAREMFERGEVSIMNDPVLIRQLSSMKYIYRSNGKIMAEPKDATKQTLGGQSPDRAEALVYMLWATRFTVKPQIEKMRRTHMSQEQKKGNTYGWSYNA